MTYTPNVPQANQTIAQTTVPIRDNFTYLDDALQEEHSFNGSAPGVEIGTHLRASMPNQADPGALPTGTDGQYYVNSGRPKYSDGTSVHFLPFSVAGSNAVGSGVAFTILGAGNYMGVVSAFQFGSPIRYQLLQFYMNGGVLTANNAMASGGTGNITLQLNAGALQIVNGSGSPQIIKWQIFYTISP